MADGVKTTEVEESSVVDALIGNRGKNTVAIPIARVGAQIGAEITQVNHETRAQLYADLNWDAGVKAAVWSDPDEALRGIYIKEGVVGAGGWSRIGGLPQSSLTTAQLAAKVGFDDVAAGVAALNSGATYPLRPASRHDGAALITSPANVALNAVLLDVRVAGGDPAMFYRVAYIQNGNPISGRAGHRVVLEECRKVTFETEFARVIILDTTMDQPDIDPAGGIQTLTYRPPLRPEVRIDLVIDASKLPPSGTPIDAYSDSARDGWSWIIDPICVEAGDTILRPSQLPRPNTLSWTTDQYGDVIVVWADHDKWRRVRIGPNGPNAIPNFKGYWEAPRIGQVTPVWAVVTGYTSDWLPPLIASADESGDGADPMYTGGNHAADGTTSPDGDPTARCTLFEMMADGAPVTLGQVQSGTSERVTLRVVNEVMGYNTIAAGRYVRCQTMAVTLRAGSWEVVYDCTPIEPSTVQTDNGPQIHTQNLPGGFATQRILGGPAGRVPLDTSQNSGPKSANPNAWAVVLQGDGRQLVSWRDPSYGCGDGRYVADTQPLVRGGGANLKFYHALVATPTQDAYFWRGGYHWSGYEPVPGIDSTFTIWRGGQEHVVTVRTDGTWTITPEIEVFVQPAALDPLATKVAAQAGVYGVSEDDGAWSVTDPAGEIAMRIGADGKVQILQFPGGLVSHENGGLSTDLLDLGLGMDGYFMLVDAEGEIGYLIGADGALMWPVDSAPPPASMPDVKPIYPKRIFGVTNDVTVPLFVDGLLAGRSDAESALCTVTSANHGTPTSASYEVSGTRQLDLDFARIRTSARLMMRARGQSAERQVLPVIVETVALPVTASPRILMIGDSLTRQVRADLIKRRLQVMGMTAEFIGTVTLDGVSGDGPLGEGRAGWRWADYTHQLTAPSQPIAPGGEAAYLALPQSGSGSKAGYNPFIRAATGGDPADLVYNGCTVDIDFYLDRFGLADPDIVIVGLFANGIASAATMEEALAEITAGVHVYHTRLRERLPNAWIAYTADGRPREPVSDAFWAARQAPGLRHLIATVQSLGDPKADVLPNWAHMSPEAWRFDLAAADALGIQAATISDSVHSYSSIALNGAVEIAARYIAVQASKL